MNTIAINTAIKTNEINNATNIFTTTQTTIPSNIVQFPAGAILTTKGNKAPVLSKSNRVDPIRSQEDIKAVIDYFLSQPQRYQSNATSIRNYMMFVVGCNCLRRISDMLKFCISDFIYADGTFKYEIKIKEEKTGKYTKFLINDAMKFAITKYLSALPYYELSDYLFKSRNRAEDGGIKAITRQQAWTVINDMSKAIKLYKKGINAGCHTMRKTGACAALDAAPNNPRQMVTVQNMLNHSSLGMTQRYLGIDQEAKNEVYNNLNIGMR